MEAQINRADRARPIALVFGCDLWAAVQIAAVKFCGRLRWGRRRMEHDARTDEMGNFLLCYNNIGDGNGIRKFSSISFFAQTRQSLFEVEILLVILEPIK